MRNYLLSMLTALILLPLSSQASDDDNLYIPKKKERPEYLYCGVDGSKLINGKGSRVIVKSKTKLIYNAAKPKVESTQEDFWGNIGFEHFITWKLNKRKTAPVVLEFTAEKVDLINPSAGALKKLKAKITIKPSMISYFIAHPQSFEENDQFGFDLQADSNGNALKMEYSIEDVKESITKNYVTYGSKDEMGLYYTSHDFTYFTMRTVLPENDELFTHLEGESVNNDAYFNHIEYIVKRKKTYLGNFTITCTLRKNSI